MLLIRSGSQQRVGPGGNVTVHGIVQSINTTEAGFLPLTRELSVQSGLALFGRAYPGLSTAPKLPPPALLSRYTEALLERIQALLSVID
jgi:hypothetical protein